MSKKITGTMTAAQFKAYMQRRHSSTKGKPRKQDESKLQEACVKWFRSAYPNYRRLLFAIPNGVQLHGTKKERIITWKRLEKEGAVAGAADLFLSIPSGDLAGLYIEMKTPTGTQQDTQKEFERDVLDAGYGYCMPRSNREFSRIVKMYLETGKYDK